MTGAGCAGIITCELECSTSGVQSVKPLSQRRPANGSLPGSSLGMLLADFLLGDATELMQTNNEFRGHQCYPIVSPYFEDQWKATRRLTLTLGIRYAYSPNTYWVGSGRWFILQFRPFPL